ncbi:isochorismatase family protein [Microbacterium sp. Sa4CUA7]|uniref:Isochorismatase family protein n=1 Tax=Microbacterium pullorum TaxID=2762236 RepID=A0ABR8S3P0_9MICO|nr:isochorismatase family protein [Microbacterium pullorum]MBD7958102.1 isochorismatase family protein [Microbacterium pullorum]
MTQTPRTALLVIDAQESFRQRTDDWAATANPRVLENIALLVERARINGGVVVWVTHSEPGTGGVFDPDNGFVRVVSEFEPRPHELRVTKTTVNAFASTDLQRQLVDHGVERVVICGIRTEQCCETTARVASDLGFAVEFVTDATTTSAITAGEGYGAVSGEDIMRRTESILGAREFARIVTTAERTAVTAVGS